MRKLLVIFFLCVSAVSAQEKTAAQPAPAVPDLAELRTMTARFAPTPLRVDLSGLSAGDRKAIAKLVEAAKIVNTIFMKQFWSGDIAMYQKLQGETAPLGKARLDYFWINKGPWSEIDQYAAFLPDVPARKLPGANFYPENMTKEEFESWGKTLSPEAKEQAEGFFTVIRRGADGRRKAVPYSGAYKSEVDGAGELLREAAASADNASLKNFLTTRADAFA